MLLGMRLYLSLTAFLRKSYAVYSLKSASVPVAKLPEGVLVKADGALAAFMLLGSSIGFDTDEH